MSLRCAVYYDDIRRIGRNDGAPMYVWNVLKNQMGHDAHHLIPSAEWLKGWGKFDLNFWIDWGEDALGGIIDYEPIPTPMPGIYWASDTHLGFDYRLSRARQTHQDGGHVFCMQKRAVEEFAAAGVPALWVPHAAEPKAYPKITAIKDYDVCFIGNINSQNRIEFLDRMFKAFPNFFFGRRVFEEAAAVFGRTKVVLHHSIRDDIAMRVFETLATGSFLLCNEIPTLSELFQDGVHLATFKTLDEAVEKAKYYLAHEDERERIAKAGYEEVIAKHTYRHRVERILETVGLKDKELVTCQP